MAKRKKPTAGLTRSQLAVATRWYAMGASPWDIAEYLGLSTAQVDDLAAALEKQRPDKDDDDARVVEAHAAYREHKTRLGLMAQRALDVEVELAEAEGGTIGVSRALEYLDALADGLAAMDRSESRCRLDIARRRALDSGGGLEGLLAVIERRGPSPGELSEDVDDE